MSDKPYEPPLWWRTVEFMRTDGARKGPRQPEHESGRGPWVYCQTEVFTTHDAVVFVDLWRAAGVY